MVKIQSVDFLENFQLKIELTNGTSRIYDMNPKLKTVRFYDLRNPEMFSKGVLKSGQVICWTDGTELSLDEILSGNTGKE